jgi:TPR repeat protein
VVAFHQCEAAVASELVPSWAELTPDLRAKMDAVVAHLEAKADFDQPPIPGFALSPHKSAKLGSLLKDSEGVMPAAEPTEAAEKRGDVASMHLLALLVSAGMGAPQDDARAVGLWKEASERGHLEATFCLAEMTYNDRGVLALKGGTPHFNQFRAVRVIYY